MSRIRNQLDLQALSAFTRIAQTGSFHEAARQLGLSASALSQTIKNLEAELGQPLIDRSSRPVSLTRYAELMLPAIQRLVDDASALHKRLIAFDNQAPANLRLGCIDSFAATVGPALIRSLDTHDNSLQLYSGLSPDISRQLLNHHIDFAVSTDPLTEHEAIHCVALFRESWLAVYPQGQAPGTLQTSLALCTAANDLDFIRYSLRSRIGAQLERFAVHHGIRAARRFEFDETETLLALVAAGIGWAISSPLCLLQSQHSLDRVQIRELSGRLRGSREFYLLWRDDADREQAALLIRIIRQIVGHTILKSIRQAFPDLSDAVLTLADSHG